jgi:hypothetical protein
MFKVNLAAFYRAFGVTPPNAENAADPSGVIEVKDGTDFSNLCRRSGIPKDAAVTVTFPDVCFVPAPPAGPVPIPYPNAMLDNFNNELRKGGFPKVKIRDAGKPSGAARISGDEAGTQKGLASPMNIGKASYTSYSNNVKFEGKSGVRHSDMTMASFR